MENKKSKNGLNLRPMNLKEDYDKLVPFYDMIFERELSIKGGSAKTLLDENRSFLPIAKILGVFLKNYKHIFDGFVYENEQKDIVSTINIGYSGDYWEIAMVATHPDYRKMGLARNLIDVSLTHAKKHKAKMCILEVLEDNTPAYNLYKSIGFTHFDTITKLKLEHEKLLLINEKDLNLPNGFSISEAKRDKKTSQDSYELEVKSTPDEVLLFIPVNKIKYHKPLLLRLFVPLIKLFIKTKSNRWIVRKDDEVIGIIFTYYGKSNDGYNELSFVIDPEYEESISKFMVKFALNKIKENSSFNVNTIITCRKSDTNQLKVLLDNGFSEFEINHLLGLKIEQ
ncbi:MAG: GNAT family N-acetyltransferase [Candidatus Thorarchaeota archaeon]